MKPYIQSIDISGLRADIGSDWHLSLRSSDIVTKVTEQITRERSSDILLVPGDIFDTPDGQDSSEAVGALLRKISTLYQFVVFCPGNHDLRGRVNPFVFPKLPKNILTTDGINPQIHQIFETKILVANVLYDTLPARTSNDRFIVGSGEALFARLTETAAKHLTPSTDILMTHVLPHAAFIPENSFRFPSKPGTTHRETPKKLMTLGSNVLGHPAANFCDGIVCVFGHHHRDENIQKQIGEKSVHGVSYQRGRIKMGEDEEKS